MSTFSALFGVLGRGRKTNSYESVDKNDECYWNRHWIRNQLNPDVGFGIGIEKKTHKTRDRSGKSRSLDNPQRDGMSKYNALIATMHTNRSTMGAKLLTYTLSNVLQVQKLQADDEQQKQVKCQVKE